MTHHDAGQPAEKPTTEPNSSPDSQLLVGRLVRFVGCGAAGLVGVLGLIGLVLSAALVPRRVVGCIVEPGPNLALTLAVFAIACGTAALLGCARRATAGFVGGGLLVLAGAMSWGSWAAGVDWYALALGLLFVLTATLATCIEEFPTALLRAAARKTS